MCVGQPDIQLDVDNAVVRQFSHWPCHTLSWTRSLAGLASGLVRPTRISRQPSFGYKATAANAAPLHEKELSVVVMDFCLFLLASTALSPSGNAAGVVFFLLVVSRYGLRRSISLNEFIVEIGPRRGSGQEP